MAGFLTERHRGDKTFVLILGTGQLMGRVTVPDGCVTHSEVLRPRGGRR